MKEIFSFLLTLWILFSLTFVLMRAIPGDPFASEQSMPHEIQEKIREQYGLNDSWLTQYGKYIYSVITLDLGPSFKYKNRTVNEIIWEGFPVSAILGFEAIIMALSLGVFIGIISAIYPNVFLTILVAVSISIPSFIMATLLQYVFAIKLGFFPVARFGSFAQTILPALSLATLPAAFLARMIKSNMVEIMQKDYIKSARAKGLSETKIILKHALKNALLPILPYIGQMTANILVGSFVIEKIFGIPGLGKWFVTSVINRDYTVIMGITLFYGIILLSAVSFCDFLYKTLDPRLGKKCG